MYKKNLTLEEEDTAVQWARIELQHAYTKHVRQPLLEKQAARMSLDTIGPSAFKLFFTFIERVIRALLRDNCRLWAPVLADP